MVFVQWNFQAHESIHRVSSRGVELLPLDTWLEVLLIMEVMFLFNIWGNKSPEIGQDLPRSLSQLGAKFLLKFRTCKQWPPASNLHPYHIKLVLFFNPNLHWSQTGIITAIGLALTLVPSSVPSTHWTQSQNTVWEEQLWAPFYRWENQGSGKLSCPKNGIVNKQQQLLTCDIYLFFYL